MRAIRSRKFLSDFEIVRGIAADHLQIDRSRQAEIQNLIGDVGGLKEEHHVGKLLAEPLAELYFVIAHRAVILAVQRNRNFAVGGGNVRDIALCEAAPGVRNSDVVQNRIDFAGGKSIADFLLDVGKAKFGLFDSRPGALRACSRSVPASTSGKKSWPTIRNSPREPNENSRNAEENRRAMPQRKVEKAHVAIAKPLEQIIHSAMKTPQETLAAMPSGVIERHFTSKQPVHHRGNQSSRQKIRRRHRKHDCHRKRRKQIAGSPGQQQHRHEHNTDGQRGNKCRHRNLRSAVENCADQRLLHRQISMRILDLDRRVIDQNADG